MSPLETMQPIGLDELVDKAALLTRIDRKYVLPHARLEPVLHALAPHARVLDIDGAREFGYASTYYDDAALTSFHLAAHGRRRRFKVRTRTYVATGSSYVEVKTRGIRGTTVKQRLLLSASASPFDVLPAEAAAFVGAALDGFGVEVPALTPVLHTAYRRSTLLMPACGARVTVDSALAWSRADGAHLALPDLVVLETKSGPRASAADRLLWSLGLRPARISKYATGLAALDRSVRGNRWAPVVRRHFPPPSAPSPPAISSTTSSPPLSPTLDRTAA
jgi:hypothetical protein